MKKDLHNISRRNLLGGFFILPAFSMPPAKRKRLSREIRTAAWLFPPAFTGPIHIIRDCVACAVNYRPFFVCPTSLEGERVAR